MPIFDRLPSSLHVREIRADHRPLRFVETSRLHPACDAIYRFVEGAVKMVVNRRDPEFVAGSLAMSTIQDFVLEEEDRLLLTNLLDRLLQAFVFPGNEVRQKLRQGVRRSGLSHGHIVALRVR